MLGGAAWLTASGGQAPVAELAVETTTSTMTTIAVTTLPLTTTSTLPVRPEGTAPAWTVGTPWGTTPGLTMFRGNPSRTWYGTGPLPTEPKVRWQFPDQPMCGFSAVGGNAKQWCGTGWTGQPVVWERPDGVTEVIFGAYDKAVHFLDAATGEPTRPEFRVGDIIKGSVTLDPDGYPLLYFGARDNKLRIVALDREIPMELWSLDARAVDGLWNDDWDGNPAIIDDILYEGGENGWFFAVALNRTTGGDGLVTVAPEILVQMPGYNKELLAVAGSNVSIESSVAVFDHTVYFANSGGRVVGLDISEVRSGQAPVVFDYWVGDDVDATVVADAEGQLYVSVELERFNQRGKELGQLIKLDPTQPDEPYVWGVPVPAAHGVGGIWATPALGSGVLYVTTDPGELVAVDTDDGEVVWRESVGWHAWSSPVLADDRMAVVTCEGQLRLYDISTPASPRPISSLQVSPSCIESTPALWGGRLYFGSRDGFFYSVG